MSGYKPFYHDIGPCSRSYTENKIPSLSGHTQGSREQMKTSKDIFEKHLVFEVPITPDKPIKVYTSDGQDLTDYFHVVSIDNYSLDIGKYATLQLTIYAAAGGRPIND